MSSFLGLNITGRRISFNASESYPKGEMIALRMHCDFYSDDIIASAKVVSCKKSSSGGYDIETEIFWVGWNNPEIQEKIRDEIITTLALYAD